MNLTQIVDGCSLTSIKTHTNYLETYPKIAILTGGLEGVK